MIKYAAPLIDRSDRMAVDKVLRSGQLTQGRYAKAFSDAICDYTGAKYCVLFNSGTSALMAACAWYAKHPDWPKLKTSLIGWNATKNAMAHNGILDGYVDVCANGTTYTRGDISCLLPVLFGGKDNTISCDGTAQAKIVDACQAFGSINLSGITTGNAISGVTCFSFHSIKNITCGEGGACTTNNSDAWLFMTAYADHGRNYLNKEPGFGFNLRMPDINAALGLSQLKKLESFKAKRYSIVEKYREAFIPIEEIYLCSAGGSETFHHLFVIRVKERDKLQRHLYEKGIETKCNYYPAKNCDLTNLPETKAFADECLSLPLHCGLSDRDVKHVIKSVKEFYRGVNG